MEERASGWEQDTEDMSKCSVPLADSPLGRTWADAYMRAKEMRRGCHGAESLRVTALDWKLEECLIKTHKVQHTGACDPTVQFPMQREYMWCWDAGCHVPRGSVYMSLCCDFHVTLTQL